jgi:nucleotide-binding universal stress UspA family protein
MQNSPSHILVPIDFSEQSQIALRQSYNMARLSNSDITLIHVIDEPMLAGIISRKKEYDEIMEDAISQKLQQQAKETAGESGLNVNVLIRRGKIYEEIVEAANDLNSSFIIMGTNGSVG